MIKSRESLAIDCNNCLVKHVCLAQDISISDIEELNSLIQNVRCIEKKNHVYHLHDPLKNLYAIYSGSCKEYGIDSNGNEFIVNFYFPGDIIGLESIAAQKYLYYMMALEDLQLCVLPLNNFLKTMHRKPNIMRRVMHLSSIKMQYDQSARLGITAHERVCDFLLNIANRMYQRKPDEKEICLPMSQIEISNFLGIAYETVNRVFQNLKKKNIIVMNNKTLEILDLGRLEELGRLDYSVMSSVSPAVTSI